MADLIILKAVESWNASQDAQARGASRTTIRFAKPCSEMLRHMARGLTIMIGPHEGLQDQVPSSRYQVSDREFRSKIAPYEYSSRFETRVANRAR